ncbi:TIGR01440 family protein [Candidatus Contubernalis alkaliaceticus]|uniref:TIGR01440 family protein n=1 Tax=Candidatus Contubernalis alkaliaceticus TaxID=338645 RepID=UPI001F4C1CA4|nr:TIGR01440 family protein [Candidatus Contubernalis alkalaceticus]UNC90868.1 TIGR01440 family protein [Candidatus Contubernalis alkalaceticus]
MEINKNVVYQQFVSVLEGLLEAGENQVSGRLLVVSCSISRVEGRREDTTGDPELARAICSALWDNKPVDMSAAVQCCEHLNRALIVERETLVQKNLSEVNVVPVSEAGGTFAAVSMEFFNDPVVVETIQGDSGIDIGLTMIGMHLKPVVMPLLLDTEYIGGARVIAARTRPKLIGGERAQYKKK